MDQTPQEIKALIIKFLQRETNDEEIAALQAWLREDELHRNYFDEINETFQASVTLGRFNPEKIDAAWKTLDHRIHEEDDAKQRFLSPPSPRHTLFKVAAAITLLLVTSYVIRQFWTTTTRNRGAMVYNSKSLTTRVDLPDGSTVWLNTNSALEYDADFGVTHRKVVLRGEAFFDVEKSSKDFIVSTKTISIYVKGTKFNVRAYADDPDVKTTLEEGKVELKVEGAAELYYMKPGDQITVNADLKKVVVDKVDPTDYSAWKEERLIFDNVPLSEIVMKLENRYTIDIVIDPSLAQREHLTMTIEHESIDEVMELIRLSSQIKYRKEKNQIIIYE
ncbi:FecR family protein [Chryseolinea lacunae]|uniref:FecR domain-containing protein n=1 Tax=Chryseolinea lacunae TaxID=2801331 RepID=A0ABS1KXI3_9BACT|nr:FecR family protein [Chryseolinea lacunae]MBL0744114.1 FecR domain-containing protein [Chryseolinea lacunae]